MGFHRFVDPSYNLGGGVFPGSLYGVEYDRVNVVSGGQGENGSAFADGPKVGGPNEGTYWHAFGEDALSVYFNRGLRALSENTDILDDMLHRDIAVPARTALVTSTGQTQVVLTGEIWLDTNPLTPLTDLFSVVDQNDREIIEPATGIPVVVTAISGSGVSAGGTVGSGFSSVAGVTLQFNMPIRQEMAEQWRVYYGERSNLAVLPKDALVKIKVRSAEEVSADVENTIRLMKWRDGSDFGWMEVPKKNLYDAAYSGLQELYNKSTAGNDGNVYTWYPVSPELNTPSAGGYFTASAFPMAGRSCVKGTSVGSFGRRDYAMGAVWWAVDDDEITATSEDHRVAASSGFVHFGHAVGGLSDHLVGIQQGPNLFGFASFSARHVPEGTGFVPMRRTHLQQNALFSFSGDIVSCPVDNWFSEAASNGETALKLGHDVLCFSPQFGSDVVDDYYTFVVVEILNNTTARIRHIDGSKPNFESISLHLVGWYAPTFTTSDNAAALHAQKYDYNDTLHHHGLTFAVLPPMATTDVPLSRTPCANFYAGGLTHSDKALVWGGWCSSGELLPTSWLSGDGGAHFEAPVQCLRGVGVDVPAFSSPQAPVVFGYFTTSASNPNIVLLEGKITNSVDGSTYGAYRHTVDTYGGLRTVNATYLSSGSNIWKADAKDRPAYLEGIVAPRGPVRRVKFDTSVNWTAWDNYGALIGIGAKTLSFVGQSVNSIAGSVGTWSQIMRTSDSMPLKVSFPKAVAGHVVEAIASLSVYADVGDKVVSARLSYRIAGGGWVPVADSERSTVTKTSVRKENLTLLGVFALPGSTNEILSDVEVSLHVWGESGATYTVNGTLHTKLCNQS